MTLDIQFYDALRCLRDHAFGCPRDHSHLRPPARHLMAVPAVALLSLALLIQSGAARAADPVRGKQLFEACAACHTDAPDAAGPRLNGVVGRAAAALPDFRYSNPMKRSRLTWTEPQLDAYLADPQALVPGSRMPYAGMAETADRRDLIEYLKTLR